MGSRWYESRTVQAAVISAVILGGAGIVAAAITAGGRRTPSATFEIKTLGEAGEQTLARMALTPAGQVVDSATFADLSQSLLVNDSLGVAFARPEGQEWTVGPLGTLQSIDIYDLPYFSFFADMEKRGWKIDTLKTRIRYFGSRRDHPVRIGLGPATAVDSVVLGVNLFADRAWSISFLRSFLDERTLRDSGAAWSVQMAQQMDSVISAKLPVEKQLFSGVFVSRVTQENFPPGGFTDWVRSDLMDNVTRSVRAGIRPPSMLIYDRERGHMIINQSIRLTNARVNGLWGSDLIVNRIGYAVRSGDYVYTVELQYVSADPPDILPALQRMFRSVRLRGEPTAAK